MSDSIRSEGLAKLAAEFDIRRFFQRAPRDWLIRYFNHHDVLTNFDWPALKKLKVDPLEDTWHALPEDVKLKMVDDFRHLAMLSTPAGKLAIIDEAEFVDQSNDVALQLTELEDFGACAFWTYLTRGDLWNGAVFLAGADTKLKRYWRKRINYPQLGRLPTNDDGERLAKGLVEFFERREGRGKYCQVHQLRRGDREYYFSYPQDHAQTSIEYEADGRQTKRPHKPAFEVIFVHNDADQTLSVWYEGRADRVRDLEVIFAQSVIGETIPRRSPRDTSVYELKAFLDEDFRLGASDVLGIESMAVRKLRLQVLGPDRYTIRVDIGEGCSDHVLYDSMRRATADVPATMLRVSQVGIKVAFEARGHEKKGRVRSFEITYPNSCSLQNHGNDILIQRMLVENGIEPKAPSTKDDDGVEST